MQITAKVHPNGSYSNYLAYGIMDNGKFKRVGYPKDLFKIEYGSSWGERGKASHEQELYLQVPDDFEYYIVKVGSGKQTQGDVDIVYDPGQHKKSIFSENDKLMILNSLNSLITDEQKQRLTKAMEC